MKGDVNTLNAVSYTEEWRSGIPDIYQSIVTVVIKSRLSIGIWHSHFPILAV